ncbi:hypothetical protein CYMTET_43921 [Cymbomonas tetramitiformis]|uniref:Uncharacterized protein n=1 Tax=Cymbomonas tetramitiformis TaxID=36881 RepID=A0AAE0F057_9CHLO|nr:hypothetical protein CYMTET_43921 [Cymbomonas tetramitiformis]
MPYASRLAENVGNRDVLRMLFKEIRFFLRRPHLPRTCPAPVAVERLRKHRTIAPVVMRPAVSELNVAAQEREAAMLEAVARRMEESRQSSLHLPEALQGDKLVMTVVGTVAFILLTMRCTSISASEEAA